MARGKSKTQINEINKRTRFKAGVQQVEIARQGGLARQAKAKQQKEDAQRVELVAESLKRLLKVKITNKLGKEIDTQSALLTALIKEALRGNIKALELILKIIGQMPSDKVEVIQPKEAEVIDNLDFVSLCERAGYPTPYPKQVEMATFVREEGARLLLGARGYGKTDYGVICAVAWALMQDPEDTWLIVTKEEQRGKDILGEIARVLEAHDQTLQRNNSRLLALTGHTGKDPNVAVLPLRSKSFRGRHPKHIICDDIITPDDVSAAERAKVEAVLAELMKLTQNVILIGQPAHAKDVYAKMRKLSGVRKMELPYGSIAQLDHDLEAQRAAGISEASIQASYYLQISESERMPFAGLEYVNFFPGNGAAGFVDPSHEGADYTAFAVGTMNFDNFVVTGFAWQKAWDDCLDDIVSVMNALKVTRFAFETNGLGKHPVVLLRQYGANVREWKSETNKHGRILNAATFKGHIKLAQYLPPQLSTPGFRAAQQAFNNMVVDYEYKAEHDDAPDALASLMQFVGLVKK